MGMGDHTEAIQIDFDPSRVTFETLLTHFWDQHHPYFAKKNRQYRSAIWYANAKQQATAKASMAEHEAAHRGPVFTAIEPLTKFYAAEEYHQKYYAKQGGGYRGSCR